MLSHGGGQTRKRGKGRSSPLAVATCSAGRVVRDARSSRSHWSYHSWTQSKSDVPPLRSLGSLTRPAYSRAVFRSDPTRASSPSRAGRKGPPLAPDTLEPIHFSVAGGHARQRVNLRHPPGAAALNVHFTSLPKIFVARSSCAAAHCALYPEWRGSA
jgi:hypothetical protein